MPASPPRCLCKAASPLRYYCPPPPEAPASFPVNPGNPNKILSKFKVLLRVFCSPGVPSPAASVPCCRSAGSRLVYALASKMLAVGSWGWLAGAGPQRCGVRPMRTILANGRARLKAPPSPRGCSRLCQVANSFQRLPFLRSLGHAQRSALGHSFIVIHLFIHRAANLFLGPV